MIWAELNMLSDTGQEEEDTGEVQRTGLLLFY